MGRFPPELREPRCVGIDLRRELAHFSRVAILRLRDLFLTIIFSGITASALGQTVYLQVTSGAASGFGTLSAAIADANTRDLPVVIEISAGLTINPGAQMIIALQSANTTGLSIVGNGAVIDMSQANSGAGKGSEAVGAALGSAARFLWPIPRPF